MLPPRMLIQFFAGFHSPVSWKWHGLSCKKKIQNNNFARTHDENGKIRDCVFDKENEGHQMKDLILVGAPAEFVLCESSRTLREAWHLARTATDKETKPEQIAQLNFLSNNIKRIEEQLMDYLLANTDNPAFIYQSLIQSTDDRLSQ
jgi:hypothetical protein